MLIWVGCSCVNAGFAGAVFCCLFLWVLWRVGVNLALGVVGVCDLVVDFGSLVVIWLFGRCRFWVVVVVVSAGLV